MKEKIYNLLWVENKALLENCFHQVIFDDAGGRNVKTFEDFLGDFYLYLLKAKPKHVEEDVEGYYLQQVKDEKALPEWLRQTFRHFLLDEIKVLQEMEKAVDEYRQQMALQHGNGASNIMLVHVAFSIAWFNQHEECVDRYLFFRSAYKHFSGFYAWPATELDDREVARILQISHDNLRQRTSRLCEKVRKLVRELNDAAITMLNKEALDIAHSICKTQDPDIEGILEGLLDQAERDLPQYAQIVELRKSKRQSMEVLRKEVLEKYEEKSICREMAPMASYAKTRSIEESLEFARQESFCFDAFQTIRPQTEPENRVVRLFKEFIGL